jgi:hypothetical protein
MHDPTQGEYISPDAADPNAQERAGAKTPEGLPWPADALRCVVGQGGAKADRYSETPANSASNRQGFAKRVRGGREKFWLRLSWQALEGQNPREAPAAVGLKRRAAAKYSRKVMDPATEALRTGPALRRRNNR